MNVKKKTKHPFPKQHPHCDEDDTFLPDICSTSSATECTGLIPNPVKSEAEAESYHELYDVYQPDGDYKPDHREPPYPDEKDLF